MKFSFSFAAFKNLLTSPLRVGALEVSATSLKYLLVRNNTIVQASLRLPPGVIERGVIKNKELLTAALKSLHQQITNSPRPVNVVLTLPSNLVYAQSFSIPLVTKDQMDETILLNLQMLSPTKIEESYYDYQEIKLNRDLGHLDLLGAFTPIATVNQYEELLRAANFVPVSVEFPGLALARLIRQRWGGIELDQNYLVIYLSGEGILMLILRNGNLAFNHFTPWQDLGGTEAPKEFSQLKEFISREIQRVLNFYLGRTGKHIEEAILISPVFNYDIVKLATEEIKIKIRNLSIAELPKLQPNWFAALGTALRGLMARSHDTDISLAAADTQTEYYQERTVNFIGLWRNIVAGSLLLVLAAFTLVDSTFASAEKTLKAQLDNGFDVANLKGSAIVQEKIKNFNTLLEFIDRTSKKETSWSPLLASLGTLTGSTIRVDHLYVSRDLRGQISARATTDVAALTFKEQLTADPRMASVSLPLSNIKTSGTEGVTFELNFTLKGTNSSSTAK